MAAHPQQEQERAETLNPFPQEMTVPGPDGKNVQVELRSVDGVLYAPMLEELDLPLNVKQYVTDYCVAWSSSVLTAGKFKAPATTPPRRAQLIFREASLHAMLGLAADERLLRTEVDQVNGEVRFLVESPRLPPMPFWNGGPPIITLPVAAYYEPVSS